MRVLATLSNFEDQAAQAAAAAAAAPAPAPALALALAPAGVQAHEARTII